MKDLKLFTLILALFFVASCTKDLRHDTSGLTSDNAALLKSSAPKVKIAVISDIHYMHPSLLPADLANSPSLLSKLLVDRKIPQLSDAIFKKVVSELISEKPDILLIAGDMAREGELIDHQAVSGLLQQLENAGINVYVVPGNNDIFNPDALSFKTEPPVQVPNITPDQFTSLYANFGYNEALYRDVNSLSYICQPSNGLWILGIDNCKRALQPSGKYKVSGDINPLTLAWIQEKMAEANAKGIMVLPFMHYGIIEHYAGQNRPEPLIKNYKDNLIALMNTGIRLMFTGHYHANDIVDSTINGKTLTDIQTGSLVTPPYSYRIMTLDDNFIKIDSRQVTSVGFGVPGGMDFLAYSDISINRYADGFFVKYLPLLFKISQADAVKLAPTFTKAFRAYVAGDEKISPANQEEIDSLAPTLQPDVLKALNSFWTDLPPNDNKIHIKLK